MSSSFCFGWVQGFRGEIKPLLKGYGRVRTTFFFFGGVLSLGFVGTPTTFGGFGRIEKTGGLRGVYFDRSSIRFILREAGKPFGPRGVSGDLRHRRALASFVLVEGRWAGRVPTWVKGNL